MILYVFGMRISIQYHEVNHRNILKYFFLSTPASHATFCNRHSLACLQSSQISDNVFQLPYWTRSSAQSTVRSAIVDQYNPVCSTPGSVQDLPYASLNIHPQSLQFNWNVKHSTVRLSCPVRHPHCRFRQGSLTLVTRFGSQLDQSSERSCCLHNALPQL